MSTISRRRAITIFAAVMVIPGSAMGEPDLPMHTWKGQALGARATLRLAHPDAAKISARVASEIDRLEDVFSLFRPQSALSRLNRQASLEAPPFELLQCLSLAGQVHDATQGRFDPTVQPLWRVYAEAAIAGHAPRAKELARARDAIGWDDVRLAPNRITLRHGMALTLNGIAQGFIADRLADLLASEGLDNILIETGEFRALGDAPDGKAWPVQLAAGGHVPLIGRALATSAPLGTSFGKGASGQSHILDPKRGVPVPSHWREISVSAKSAGLADALSTAACLYSCKSEIVACLRTFKGAKLESAS